MSTNYEQLKQQLDIIYQCAPGPHEIRVIGRRYTITLDGKNIERILLNANQDYQAYAIGTPKSSQEAMLLIQEHFTDLLPHNCYLVLNRVSDNFSLSFKKHKIGNTWVRKYTTFLTKAVNIEAICALTIDIDRKDTPKNSEGKKLAASEEELNILNNVRIDLVQEFASHNLQFAYQICSGNGFQDTLFFEPQITTEGMKAAKNAISTILEGLHQKYLERGVDIDTKLKDPCRVTRLAGILNKKPDRIEVPEENRVYRIASLLPEKREKNKTFRMSFLDILAFAESLKQWQEKYRGENRRLPSKTKASPPQVGTKVLNINCQKQYGWKGEVIEQAKGRWEEFYTSHGIRDITTDSQGLKRGFPEGSHSQKRGGFAFWPDTGYYYDYYSNLEGYPQDFLQQNKGFSEEATWKKLAEFVDIKTPCSQFLYLPLAISFEKMLRSYNTPLLGGER